MSQLLTSHTSHLCHNLDLRLSSSIWTAYPNILCRIIFELKEGLVCILTRVPISCQHVYHVNTLLLDGSKWMVRTWSFYVQPKSLSSMISVAPVRECILNSNLWTGELRLAQYAKWLCEYTNVPVERRSAVHLPLDSELVWRGLALWVCPRHEVTRLRKHQLHYLWVAGRVTDVADDRYI